jgi:diguanylate cyclase (GGDEF)-like protein/PAS domain S-box-containing protein
MKVLRDALPAASADVRHLEQVLEHVGEAVIVKDLDAVVTYWNREATALYGFAAEEAVGQSMRKLHAADLSDGEWAKLVARIRAGKATVSETERRKRSGEVVRVAIRTTPLFDADGELTGEITVARDVTLLHKTEEALRASQVSLEAKLQAARESRKTLAREIAARRRVEREQREANRKLEAMVRQLESMQRDGEALSRMAELLQSAQRDEAYAVVSDTSGELFPGLTGSLYIFRESRDVLEHAISWNADGHAIEPVLGPEDCWALRLGRAHVVHGQRGVRCRHARESHASYICMPVHGQDQVLGLVHVDLAGESRTERSRAEVERRLRTMTDRVGPALANLKLREALRLLALRDGLTGLYNRRYLEDTLAREIHRSERTGKGLAMIMIDVDHFKRFNDTFGHDAGDFVLSAIAKAIVQNIRPSDVACRYGGEELAVMLTDTDIESAIGRAERLRHVIRETNLTHRGQSLPAPSASFGVAGYPQDGKNVEELMKSADRALYEAKQAGRDRVVAANSGIVVQEGLIPASP